MFHYKLIELESELVAKEQSQLGFDQLLVECVALLDYIEREVGVRLGSPVPRDWKGWLTWRRGGQAMIVSRGRSFKEGFLSKSLAGLDVVNGLDSITEYRRGFDVTPPQDLDHLLINFGGTATSARVFLWYGENIAPYKLIYVAEVESDPHKELSEAIVECCTWILTRPKDQTLSQFLQNLADGRS